MRLNWHELPDTLQYCTDNEIGLFYNQLDSPIGLSLTTLPAAELARVVDTLERQEPQLPATPVGLENLRNYRELVARLRGFLQPENRTAGLRARLDTARAVVSHYSSVDDRLTQAVKNYLIVRLNVEDANGELPVEFSERVEDVQRILAGVRHEVGSSHFLSTYLKELIRTYSGVWGVVSAHDTDVFRRIDELVTSEAANIDNWDRLLRLPPRTVYEAIGLTASVDAMRRWLADL
jgi:hypothetical protein